MSPDTSLTLSLYAKVRIFLLGGSSQTPLSRIQKVCMVKSKYSVLPAARVLVDCKGNKVML